MYGDGVWSDLCMVMGVWSDLCMVMEVWSDLSMVMYSSTIRKDD